MNRSINTITITMTAPETTPDAIAFVAGDAGVRLAMAAPDVESAWRAGAQDTGTRTISKDRRWRNLPPFFCWHPADANASPAPASPRASRGVVLAVLSASAFA